MPKPNENESEDDFVGRCIPIVLGEGTTEDQGEAAAICHSMFEQAKTLDAPLEWKAVQDLCPPCAQTMQRDGIKTITLRKLLAKQDDPDRICGDIWTNGTEDQRAAFGGGAEGRSREEQPPEAWFNDCTATVGAGATTSADPAQAKAVKHFAGKAISVDLEARTVRHWITTTTVDDDGEVMLPRGADLTRFRKSGTVFDGHDYDTRKIVGRNVGLKVSDRGIVATTRFTHRPPKHPKEVEWFPDTSLWLHHTGDLSGWSIGFDPLEQRDPTTVDKSEFLIGNVDFFNLVHSKWRLMEYSQASIPCNEDALTLAVRKGLASERLATAILDGTPLVELREKFTVDKPKGKRLVVIVPGGPPAKAEPSVQDQVRREVELVVAKKAGRIHAP